MRRRKGQNRIFLQQHLGSPGVIGNLGKGTAMVGAEYLFSKHIGLYLEPGAVWHFNNDSPIDNVYKARPFDFNLSLGLRFAF